MTQLFVNLYLFFKNHRPLMWLSMVFLFLFLGYFSSEIYLEEDLNKLMPSSRNEDGSIKLAFSSLRIKDKTFVLFQGDDVEDMIAVCDEFVDTLLAPQANLPEEERNISDVFYRIDEDLMYDAVDYLTEHLPSYIDTAYYAAFDTLLTREHMERQMARNAEDMQSEIADIFPQLLEMDPIGMRSVLEEKMAPLMSAGGGGYKTIDGHLFVPDSSVCIAIITPKFSATNTGQGSALFETLNKNIEKFKTAHPEVRILYHGTPANGYYNSSTIKKDLLTTILGSLILVLIVLGLCLRTWSSLPLLVLPVAFGTFFGLTMMYFIKGQFSLMALGIGAIVLGVAMSYALHVITHYKYTGNSEMVLREETKPVLLGCITTIGSFIGLLFIKTDLLQDFGLFAAFAIVGTTVFSLIYLPHMLDIGKSRKGERAFAIMDKLSAYPFDQSKWLMGTIAAVSLVCVIAYFIKGTTFDADMNNLSYVSAMTSESSALLREKTATGDESTYFASEGKTAEEAVENFALLDAKLDSLEKAGIVKDYTRTNVLFVPLKEQELRIQAWKDFWTQERLQKVRSLIASTAPKAGLTPEGFDAFFDAATRDYEADALYEAGIIPYGYLSTLIEETYGHQYLVLSSVRYQPDSLDANFLRICDAVTNEPELMVLDTYYYTRDTLRQLNEDFNVLQWISMAFVFAVLLLSFHFNWKHTLLGFFPILLSWLIVLGAMAIFDVRFNLINIIISTFIFGIGVDYSIFVMSGLIHENEGNKKVLERHKTAIIFSAFILVVTVASMLFAKHPAIQSVGFATLVGMVSAVVLSYVVQPAIFHSVRRRHHR